MAGQRAPEIRLSTEQRAEVEGVAGRWSLSSGLVVRARIVLELANGTAPCDVARKLGIASRTVRKWRARWQAAPGVESLLDAKRKGRPPTHSLEARCHVVKIACTTPNAEQRTFHQCMVWSQRAIRDELARTTEWRMSRSSVQRVLGVEGLRPHRVRQWMHSPAPDFAERAADICNLYLNPPKNAIVVCVDEKPIQVLGRRFPSHADGNACVRFEYEYQRHGLAYLLGALDTRTGTIVGKMVKRRTAKATVSFLRLLSKRFPGRRVIVVWDNLNTHYDGKDQRWTRFNREQGGRFEFHYTPKHASWLNQIEVWFSILQRRILRYGTFASRSALDVAVLAFIRYYNRHLAKPFNWKFNGDFFDAGPRLAA